MRTGIRKILGKARKASCDPHLLALVAVTHHLSRIPHGPEPVLYRVKIIAQFPVPVTLPMDGQEQGHRVAEIRVDNRAAYTGGQFRLCGFNHFIAELCPEKIRILDVVLQFHIDNHETRAARGIGQLLSDLRELENMFFKRFGDLLLDLLGGSTGILSNHKACPDGDRGIFSPLHFHKGVNPDSNGHGGENEGYGGVTEGALDGIHGAVFLCLSEAFSAGRLAMVTGMPSRR